MPAQKTGLGLGSKSWQKHRFFHPVVPLTGPIKPILFSHFLRVQCFQNEGFFSIIGNMVILPYLSCDTLGIKSIEINVNVRTQR